MAKYRIQLNSETGVYDVYRGRAKYGQLDAEVMSQLFPAIMPESVITAEALDETDVKKHVQLSVTVDGETMPVGVVSINTDETPADETPADETPADETPADPQPKGRQGNPDVLVEIRRRRGKTNVAQRRSLVEERRAKAANPNDPKSVLEFRRNNRKF